MHIQYMHSMWEVRKLSNAIVEVHVLYMTMYMYIVLRFRGLVLSSLHNYRAAHVNKRMHTSFVSCTHSLPCRTLCWNDPALLELGMSYNQVLYVT